MIDELDEVLRQLLVRELSIKNGEVNIEFNQPRREWSARLSRPTLNLFLHDLRENNTLRQNDWEIKRNGDGTATKTRTPVRVDLHYMITAWATAVEDEHSLLTRALIALFRHPTLPEDLLTDNLRRQPVPIPLRIAQPDELRNPADIWGAMDNELKPAIPCTITLAFNPYQSLTGPLVKTRGLLFRQTGEPGPQERFWMVGGTLYGLDSFADVYLCLDERGQDVPLHSDGKFIIGNLQVGVYTLTVSVKGQAPQKHKFKVPSAAYDIHLKGGRAGTSDPSHDA